MCFSTRLNIKSKPVNRCKHECTLFSTVEKCLQFLEMFQVLLIVLYLLAQLCQVEVVLPVSHLHYGHRLWLKHKQMKL